MYPQGSSPNLQGGLFVQGGNANIQGGAPIMLQSPQLNGINLGYGAQGTISVPGNGQHNTPTNPQNNGLSVGSSGSGSGFSIPQNSSNPALAAAINGEYDTTIGGLNNQMDQLNHIYGNQTADVNNSWNQQQNTLQHQLATGSANLDLSQHQLDTSKANSLRDLQNQLQEMIGSYGNTLGVMGAGNSSADQMIRYAIGREGARNTNDINQQTANQQTSINLQRNNLQTNFGDQLAALNQWKQQQLDNLANTFAQQQLSNQNAVKQAQAYKAAGLAMYGQPGAQDAIAKLQALDAQYSDALGSLKQAYGVSATPGADLSQYMNGYNVAPISQQQLTGMSMNNNQASYTPVTAYPVTTKQNNNNIPLS